MCTFSNQTPPSRHIYPLKCDALILWLAHIYTFHSHTRRALTLENFTPHFYSMGLSHQTSNTNRHDDALGDEESGPHTAPMIRVKGRPHLSHYPPRHADMWSTISLYTLTKSTLSLFFLLFFWCVSSVEIPAFWILCEVYVIGFMLIFSYTICMRILCVSHSGLEN